jgi:hypothetical protein
MIIEDIVTQHEEDAAFLWLLRDSAAVHDPHYDLKDLSELDNRVNPIWMACASPERRAGNSARKP